jgi:hypothetical protein
MIIKKILIFVTKKHVIRFVGKTMLIIGSLSGDELEV